jgi:hypothetical protein
MGFDIFKTTSPIKRTPSVEEIMHSWILEFTNILNIYSLPLLKFQGSFLKKLVEVDWKILFLIASALKIS